MRLKTKRRIAIGAAAVGALLGAAVVVPACGTLLKAAVVAKVAKVALAKNKREALKEAGKPLENLAKVTGDAVTSVIEDIKLNKKEEA